MTLYRVLGPIGVERDGHAVSIGSPLQRRLLAVLLVHAPAVVSADRLVDILWGSGRRLPRGRGCGRVWPGCVPR